VTEAFLLRRSVPRQTVVYFSHIMKSTIPMRIRMRRFITDRYAYKTDSNYEFELVAFGLIVATALWPIFVVASAFAGTLR
jgi:hypothetical protein